MKMEGFYRGVVEDNKDPLKQNRVKVRIVSAHSSDIELSTDSLSWAEQANSVFLGSMQGIGISSVPVQGSWVWVFFEQGNVHKPVYFASAVCGPYASLPEQNMPYRDKDLYGSASYKYPRQDRLSSTDVNNLSTLISLDGTAHKLINTNKMSADGMTEPESTSDKTLYTYNNVIETQSGHVLEFDDTVSNERIRLFHKSGSYEEVRPNGDRTLRTNGKYIICTTEELNEMVVKSVQRYIGENLLEHIKGNVDLVVDGDLNWKVNGEIRFSAGNILYKGGTIQLNPPFGFAEPALTDSGVTYSQALVEVASPVVEAQDESGATVSNAPGPEVTGGETEEKVPEDSPVSADGCTNPWTTANGTYSSIGASGWKENGANKNILSLWEEIGQPKTNDRTAWCACFLSATLKRSKCKYKPTPSSQAYSSYGQAVTGWTGSKANWDANVKKGDILVFSHGGGSGHVGLYNGDSSRYPKIGVLGGNQSDTLNILYFECNKSSPPMQLIAVRRAVCEDGNPVSDA
jgi:uncharacterized protein (TIGR02594 family)